MYLTRLPCDTPVGGGGFSGGGGIADTSGGVEPACESFTLEAEEGCHFRLHTRADALACLKGQHVVVIGASVAYALALQLLQLFDAPECDTYPCDSRAWLNCQAADGGGPW
jgi:hypothetical protein